MARWGLLCLVMLFSGAFASPALAQIDASPTTLSFTQDIADGATDPPQFASITNNSGADVHVTGVSFTGDTSDFTVLTDDPEDCSNAALFVSAAGCSVRVIFDPTTTGPKSADYTLQTDGGNATITFDGTATERGASASPTSFDFMGQTIGSTSDPEPVTLTNSGTGPLTFNSASFTGVDATDFQLDPQPGDCTAMDVLPEGGSCDVHVTFSPSFTGLKSATLNFDTNTNGLEPTVDLSGSGTEPILSADTTDLTITQDVDDGPSSPPTESVVTNTGSEPVTITGVTIEGTDAARFSLDGTTTCADGVTLAVNGTCTVDVTYDPTTQGATDSASVKVASNAPDLNIGLTGNATQTSLDLSPTSLHFGTWAIAAGQSPPHTATITNNGTEDVTLNGISTDGDFPQLTDQPGTDCTDTMTLAAGESCELRYAFDPTTTGSKSATILISSNELPDLSLSLDGTANNPVLTPSPTSHNFGSQDVDEGATSPPQDFTFTSTGDDTVDVSSVSIDGGGNDQFQRVSGANECTSSSHLANLEQCHVYVVFNPTAVGPKTASVTVHSNGADTSAGLSGDGTQTEVTPAPTALHFGSQELGAGPTVAQTSTVTNTGTEPVSVTGVSIGGAQRGQFKLLTGNADDCGANNPIAANGTCKVRAQFDPSWSGPKSATVTVASNAPNAMIALDGTGTQATFPRSDTPLAGGYLIDGPVNAVAFDSAGRAYIGGAFSSIGQRTGRGVHLTTASDQADPAFPDVDGPINAVAPDGSGGWFIGGSFSNVGGTPRANLAHILSSGALDSAWNPGANDTVNTIAVGGSSVYVGGSFLQAGGQPSVRLAKLSASTGVLDTGWTPGPNNTVLSLAVDGSNVYAGGNFTTIGGQNRNRVARLDSVGAADSFNPDANGTVNAIAVSGPDVYLGGAFTQVSSQPRNRVAKVTAGVLDGTWDPNANGAVNALAVDATGVYTGGAFTSIGGQTRNRIARLSATTGLADASWDPNSSGAVNAIRLSGTDVYTVGSFTSIGGQTRHRIARLSASTGSADSWNPDANGTAAAIAIAGSDIYVGGAFTSVGGQVARGNIARLLPDGTIDPDWNPGANNTVNALIVSGTDVYAGGAFTSIGGGTHNRIARLTTGDGAAADPLWNPDANGTVFALSLTGTDLYVGGSFTQVNSATHTRLVKLSTTNSGTPDSTWVASASASVVALASDASFVYAGGSFVNLGGQTRLFIGRVDATGAGTVDGTWAPNADSVVNALALSGGDLFAGGAFSSIGGQTRSRIAKLSTSGSGPADVSWDPNANGTVRALTIAGTDIYAGGDFTTVSGQPHGRIVRLATSDGGAADPGWDPAANASVNALASTSDRLGAGGAFTTAFGQSRQSFALFDLPRLWRDPSSLQFGSWDVDDGQTVIRTSTVRNSGATPLSLTSVTDGGTDSSQFVRLTGDPNDCSSSTTLLAGGTCTVRARFDPSTTGVKSAFVTIAAPGTPDATVGLVGTGTQADLSRSPASLAFGSKDVDDGATAVMQSTVTNSGTQTVTLASTNSVVISGGDAADFTRLDDDPQDCRDGLPLASGQTCKLRVQFDPATVGAKSATLTVNSDTAPITVDLSGTGIQTQLSRSPASLSFGSKDIDDGATATQTSTVTNSGTEDVTISSIDVPAHFTRATGQGTDCAAAMVLHAGNTCELRIAFDPSTTGLKSGSVTVHSNAPDVSVAVDGTGIQTELSLSPTSRPFGNRDIDDGPTSSMSSTLTNTGTQSVTLTGINPSGDSGDFPRQSGAGECTSTQTLAANDSCTLTYTFDPGTVGGKSATYDITSNAATVTLTLTGQGTQTELSRSPTSLDFHGQDVDSGPTAAQTSTVTNSGTESVTISGIALGGTDPGEFARLTGNGDDCTNTTTLAAGQTCKVRIEFNPSTIGSKSATVTVSSNAPSIAIDLAGVGKDTKLSHSPSSLSFGSKDVDDGATPQQSATITNVGSEDVTLGSVGIIGTDGGEFVRQTGNTDDCAVGTTLHATDTCKVRVTFDPSTVGSKSATARVSANGVDQDVSLSGTGIQTELSRSPSTLSFGSKDIDDGATAAQTSTVTNSGTEDVTISALAVPEHFTQLTGQPSDCTAELLHATQTCELRIAFDPTSVGAKSGSVTVHSNAADVSVAVDGTGTQTQLTPDSTSLSFGSKDIEDGATAAQTTTVTNTGTEPVTLSGVNQAGSTDFTRSTGAGHCSSSTTLTAGQSCTVSATFDPSSVGGKTGSITLTSSQVPDIVISLSGTGIQTELSRAPASLAFGNKGVDDGASGARTSVITNSGTQDVTLTASAIAVTGDFAQATGAPGDCGNGTLLHAGETCNLRIRFDPTTTGPRSGTATVHSNAADVSVTLSHRPLAVARHARLRQARRRRRSDRLAADDDHQRRAGHRRDRQLQHHRAERGRVRANPERRGRLRREPDARAGRFMHRARALRSGRDGWPLRHAQRHRREPGRYRHRRPHRHRHADRHRTQREQHQRRVPGHRRWADHAAVGDGHEHRHRGRDDHERRRDRRVRPGARAVGRLRPEHRPARRRHLLAARPVRSDQRGLEDRHRDRAFEHRRSLGRARRPGHPDADRARPVGA
jgi:trimeric autotransporter adhesin